MEIIKTKISRYIINCRVMKEPICLQRGQETTKSESTMSQNFALNIVNSQYYELSDA